jgi:hypothetical protein
MIQIVSDKKIQKEIVGKFYPSYIHESFKKKKEWKKLQSESSRASFQGKTLFRFSPHLHSNSLFSKLFESSLKNEIMFMEVRP